MPHPSLNCSNECFEEFIPTDFSAFSKFRGVTDSSGLLHIRTVRYESFTYDKPRVFLDDFVILRISSMCISCELKEFVE
jgi:hypothetical protein